MRAASLAAMADWTTLQTDSGDRALVCGPLAGAGLAHMFTLRPAGTIASGTAIPAGLLARIALDGIPISRPRQVHGSIVATPAGASGGTSPPEADAVAVTTGGGAAAIATADCVGAILLDPGSGAFAVVHAGWRGTLARVVPAAIETLTIRGGARPGRMVMAMGPSIRGCCYEVGEEVLAPFRRSFPDADRRGIFGERGGRETVDLVAANRALAEQCGLDPLGIHASDLCTSCRTDLCWSYRKAGAGAGRMWTLAGRPG
ncbi:MAG: polyphenol oxidase family protein [Acidobacteria bacterium]|nr:polyphenol oxidase family protein [Acidobacteriota bacterium]